MSRPKTHLAYTEVNARPRTISVKSKAGKSSGDSKAVENKLDDMNKKASQDHGKFYLENATQTEF